MERDSLWSVVKILPSDYDAYGGKEVRWADAMRGFPDCSAGCRHFRRLMSEQEEFQDSDWGVCCNPKSPRAGLLTFEHQAGLDCFETE
jgi:hypothetical protein